jgi:hypothetical protein
MNRKNTVQLHCLDELVIAVEETRAGEGAADCRWDTGDLAVRGDELQGAERLNKVAQLLAEQHMNKKADLVKEHVRAIVAKQLNEFDGFDR